jgi:F-type H+-transporting ATPase subunit delta
MAESSTIARPYAQALYALAQEQGETGSWSTMLQFAALVTIDEQMVALISGPRPRSDKLAVMLAVCREHLDAAGENLIRVLAENDRLNLLPEIASLFERERSEREGTMEAEVTSAQPLATSQQQAIALALKKRLGREITLKCTVDESLVGGAIIRAGDIVIDGSVTARLERLRTQLMH